MVQVNRILFACMVYIIGGYLWLYYSIDDKNIDIELHALVLTVG